MKLAFILILTAAVLSAHPHTAAAQVRDDVKKTARTEPPADVSAPDVESTAAVKEAAPSSNTEATPPVRMYLVGGRLLEVDDVTESADGYWYTRGGVTTLLDRARVERIERGPLEEATSTPERDKGKSSWSISESAKVEKFFMTRFGRPLPVTAAGQSRLHTRWGYDHSQGMDVGLHPDSHEGKALAEFLRASGIPFLIFRRAIPGVATGPHIHIGRPSPGVR